MTRIRPNEALQQAAEVRLVQDALILPFAVSAVFLRKLMRLQVRILVNQRDFEGRHELLADQTFKLGRVLDRVDYSIQPEVVRNKKLLEALVKFLTDAGVHAGLLLRDQVSEANSFIDVFCPVKCNLTLFNGPPGLVDVVLQADVDTVALVDVEDKLRTQAGVLLPLLLCFCLGLGKALLRHCESNNAMTCHVFFFGSGAGIFGR